MTLSRRCLPSPPPPPPAAPSAFVTRKPAVSPRKLRSRSTQPAPLLLSAPRDGHEKYDASAGAVAVKGCRRRSRDGFSLNAALPAPMPPCLGQSKHRSLGKAAVRHGQGAHGVQDPGCTDTAVAAPAPGGPSRVVRGPGGGVRRALTMLPLSHTSSARTAVAPLGRPGPAAALYRGRHPRSGAGGPAYLICINLHRPAYILRAFVQMKFCLEGGSLALRCDFTDAWSILKYPAAPTVMWSQPCLCPSL